MKCPTCNSSLSAKKIFLVFFKKQNCNNCEKNVRFRLSHKRLFFFSLVSLVILFFYLDLLLLFGGGTTLAVIVVILSQKLVSS